VAGVGKLSVWGLRIIAEILFSLCHHFGNLSNMSKSYFPDGWNVTCAMVPTSTACLVSKYEIRSWKDAEILIRFSGMQTADKTCANFRLAKGQ
jgi:hypothetical protein